MSSGTYEKRRRAQDLLRHTIPNGDPAAILDRALTLLVAELEKTKLAATARPQAQRPSAAGSRHVPAAIKRGVWTRDGGQCAFVGGTGRCTERGVLEYHHVVPYAEGGTTTTDNLQLRCFIASSDAALSSWRSSTVDEYSRFVFRSRPRAVSRRCSFATADSMFENTATGQVVCLRYPAEIMASTVPRQMILDNFKNSFAKESNRRHALRSSLAAQQREQER